LFFGALVVAAVRGAPEISWPREAGHVDAIVLRSLDKAVRAHRSGNDPVNRPGPRSASEARRFRHAF
jgi:hypothetical protein